LARRRDNTPSATTPGSVAQGIEHRSPKAGVAGSNPAGAATLTWGFSVLGNLGQTVRAQFWTHFEEQLHSASPMRSTDPRGILSPADPRGILFPADPRGVTVSR